MPKLNKILVIGASIAGPTVCYWLKKFGFSPTLIEKHDSLRKGGYAIDIRGIATGVVKKMGIYTQEEYNLINLGSYLSIFSIPNYLNLNHSEMLFETNQGLAHISSDKDPNIAHVGFMFRSNQPLKDLHNERKQKDFLRKNFHDLGWEVNKLLELMESCDDFYFDSTTQVKMCSWTKGRVALVGDAGYCPSPLSGQGTSLALVGAYILAGELKAADENYSRAFSRYNTLLQPYVEATQNFGVWVSESFLVPGETSKEGAEERANKVLNKMQHISSILTLPEY